MNSWNFSLRRWQSFLEECVTKEDLKKHSTESELTWQGAYEGDIGKVSEYTSEGQAEELKLACWPDGSHVLNWTIKSDDQILQ